MTISTLCFALVAFNVLSSSEARTTTVRDDEMQAENTEAAGMHKEAVALERETRETGIKLAYFHPMFKDLDKDNDGKVTKEDVSSLIKPTDGQWTFSSEKTVDEAADQVVTLLMKTFNKRQDEPENDKTLNEREFSSMMAKFVNEGFKVWLGGATKKKKKWWEEHMH